MWRSQHYPIQKYGTIDMGQEYKKKSKDSQHMDCFDIYSVVCGGFRRDWYLCVRPNAFKKKEPQVWGKTHIQITRGYHKPFLSKESSGKPGLYKYNRKQDRSVWVGEGYIKDTTKRSFRCRRDSIFDRLCRQARKEMIMLFSNSSRFPWDATRL
jgi:hypothetical protein